MSRPGLDYLHLGDDDATFFGPKTCRFFFSQAGFLGGTLPDTTSSPLKINGWKMTLPIFRGHVSFREGEYRGLKLPLGIYNF